MTSTFKFKVGDTLVQKNRREAVYKVLDLGYEGTIPKYYKMVFSNIGTIDDYDKVLIENHLEPLEHEEEDDLYI